MTKGSTRDPGGSLQRATAAELKDVMHEQADELWTVIALLKTAQARHDPGTPIDGQVAGEIMRVIGAATGSVERVIEAFTPYV